MVRVYHNTGIAALALLAITAAILYAGYQASHTNQPLVPAGQGHVQTNLFPPEPRAKTYLQLKEEGSRIAFDFFLDSRESFPYAHYANYFLDQHGAIHPVDFTAYQRVSFDVTCTPKNVLMFVVSSVDKKTTDVSDPHTSRISATAFTCDETQRRVTMELANMQTPHWWLSQQGYDYSDTGYQRDKVIGYAWVSTFQSPKDQIASVTLAKIQLHGETPHYRYGALAIVVSLWVIVLWRLTRAYLHYLRLQTSTTRKNSSASTLTTSPAAASLPTGSESVRQPLPYNKVEIARPREKELVMRYLSTEYTRAQLSLEQATSALGLNRNKINDILKEETGLTFSAYLNRLRLKEAARLLADGKYAVSEVAYSVGYNNVSYFNKLFKEEYGCAPTQFKALHQALETQ